MSLLVTPPAVLEGAEGFNDEDGNPLDNVPEPENGTDDDPKPVDARILNLYFREVQRVLGGEAKCDESGIKIENEDDYVTLDGDIDDDNIRSIGERKVKFYEFDPPNSGHDHDGVESTKVSETPESGITFDPDDENSHHHDGVDSPLLALATGSKQGSVILRSGTTAAGISFTIDLKALGYAQIPYCIRVWEKPGATLANYGVGRREFVAFTGGTYGAGNYGYYWNIDTADDEILLKINSALAKTFTWYAIGI